MKLFQWRWLVVLAVLAAAPAPAADKTATAEDVLAKSSAQFDQMKAWSADFQQSMNMLGATMKFAGTMQFKQPRQMRIAMDMPMLGQQMQMTMVMGNDMIMWQQIEMGGQRQHMKMDMAKIMSNALAQAGIDLDPRKSMNPGRQWELTRQFYDYKLLPDGEMNGQPVWVIEGTWKASAATNKLVAAQTHMFGKSRLCIGQKTQVVQKMEQFDKANANVVMTVEFTNLKLDADIPDAAFQLKVPEDAKVVDLTEMAANSNPLGGLGGPAPAPPPPTPPAP